MRELGIASVANFLSDMLGIRLLERGACEYDQFYPGLLFEEMRWELGLDLVTWGKEIDKGKSVFSRQINTAYSLQLDMAYRSSETEAEFSCLIYSEWPTFSWREDGYFNRENFPEAYIVGNTLHFQDLEWYEALEDSELKEEALRNKAIIEGLINKDDESSNNGWRRWDDYEIADHDQEEREYENEHEDEERCELFDDYELPVCSIRRFVMIKYSFGQDEEYVAIKDEYEVLPERQPGMLFIFIESVFPDINTATSLKEKKSTMLVENLRSGNFEVLESRNFKTAFQYVLAHKLNLENLPSKISGEFFILILLNSRF
ncbi:hypothetical protein Tco_0847491 [Tanacetum coccineum]